MTVLDCISKRVANPTIVGGMTYLYNVSEIEVPNSSNKISLSGRDSRELPGQFLRRELELAKVCQFSVVHEQVCRDRS